MQEDFFRVVTGNCNHCATICGNHSAVTFILLTIWSAAAGKLKPCKGTLRYLPFQTTLLKPEAVRSLMNGSFRPLQQLQTGNGVSQ